MNDPGKTPDAPIDAFAVGESWVEASKAPPGRGLGRIIAAGVAVAFGLVLSLVGVLLVGGAGAVLGTPLYGLGFAIYDYRWPFGPRPGRRRKSRRPVSRRQEDY